MSATRWTLLAAILVLLLGGIYAWNQRQPADDGQSVAAPTLPAIRAGGSVVADARVVPERSAALSLPAGGSISEILVEEGSAVEAGAPLLRIDSAREAAGVLQARAQLESAEAQLAELERGPQAEVVRAAEAAVLVAMAEVRAAEARVSGAQASLSGVQRVSAEDLVIAERRFEQSKNARWGVQAQRDAVCGRVKEKLAFTQADCDQWQAQVQEAEEAVRIAELQLQVARRGGRPEDVSAAGGRVGEASGALAAARARSQQAEAELARVKQGASPEALIVARAGVDAARAALEQAELSMDDTLLRAPFAGVVAAIEAHEGERVPAGTPVLRLADTRSWRIETEDLTELDIVSVTEGGSATVRFDALSGLELEGRVLGIRSFGESRLGDITYRVTIGLDEPDPRLRWNMTATVEIDG